LVRKKVMGVEEERRSGILRGEKVMRVSEERRFTRGRA
jgi:hypothetical protein